MSVDSSRPSHHKVNFREPRGFGTTIKSDLKEAFFPDDPFKPFERETALGKVKKGLQYFVPVFSWLPKYNLKLLQMDLLAGLTLTSLSIPQGFSYAKLAGIPPINGLYCSFVPPLIYALFGDSRYMAVGNVASCSLLIQGILSEVVSSDDQPLLHLHLVMTTCFVTGVMQTLMGVLRLGILVDFLSHSTITGFMGGTATIISLQQLKQMLRLKIKTKSNVVSVLKGVFTHTKDWHWQSFLAGFICYVFLHITKIIKEKKPKLFWVPAMAPLVAVLVGCLLAWACDAEKYGIATVGPLKRGVSPISIHLLNFDGKYFSAVLKAGCITGLIALAEGIAIGRSFGILTNEQIDGNKEMVAFGLMNIAGSFTSAYLTTGPFSKTAVNFSAGAKSQMANAVMSLFMLLVLLFLAPIFSYTPLVVLCAIIVSAMLNLIKYDVAIELFKVDKFDFVICMTAFIGVAFFSMDYGLSASVLLGVIRALLYMARPGTCTLGKLPDSVLYRDLEQYPDGIKPSGLIVLQVGSPVYFSNSNYLRERVLRWVRDEQSTVDSKGDIEYVLLEMSGVVTIDMTGIETLMEIKKALANKGIKLGLINPRMKVLEKITRAHFVDKIGKDNIFLSIEDAIETCRFSLHKSEAEPLAEQPATDGEDN